MVTVLCFFNMLMPNNADTLVHNQTGIHGEMYADIVNILKGDLSLDSTEIIVALKDFNTAMVNQYGSISVVDGAYVINIQKMYNRKSSAEVFIHELVHVNQMKAGRLKLHPGYAWFEGKYYNKQTPEDKLPYETEAWDKSRPLYKKFIAEYFKK